MPATHPVRTGSFPWLLVILIGVGLVVVGGGAVGGYFAWQAGRTKEMDREFWAIEQKNIDRTTADALRTELVKHRNAHFDEFFPRRGLRHELELLSLTKKSDDEVFKGEAAFIAKYGVSVDQFRNDFRRRHPDMESVLVEIPAAVRGVAERHFNQIRAEVAKPEVQKEEEAKSPPWQEYSTRRAEACFAEGITSIHGLDSYQRLQREFAK